MTGYGRAEKTIDGREITVEMRAVNNRYLDLNVKLPRVYGFAEDAVKSLIKANVNRGKLDLFITVNVTADTSLQISLNKPVLEGYLAALKSIAADYGVRDDISVTALSRMPDVFVVEKQEEDEQKLTDDILSVVKEALDPLEPVLHAVKQLHPCPIFGELLLVEYHPAFGFLHHLPHVGKIVVHIVRLCQIV